MDAFTFFGQIEEIIPLDLALDGDSVGYIGDHDPQEILVRKVLVLMDYLSPDVIPIDYSGYDLLILHHPPGEIPRIPSYIIHSNWDIIQGGACDALAECLDIIPDGVLDIETNIGRVGKIRTGPVSMRRFIQEVQNTLKIVDLRMVHCHKDDLIERVALISGFGLNPKFIRMAKELGVDLLLSGDLTHSGAILAKNLSLPLIDATHHGTELPGLHALGRIISSFDVEVCVYDTCIPWIGCQKTQNRWNSLYGR